MGGFYRLVSPKAGPCLNTFHPLRGLLFRAAGQAVGARSTSKLWEALARLQLFQLSAYPLATNRDPVKQSRNWNGFLGLIMG